MSVRILSKNIQLRLKSRCDTYLFLLLIEVVYYDTNEEIESEEGSKYDENNKIEVHPQVDLILWLFVWL